MAPAEPAGRVTYRDVLAVPEFRALYIAQALSQLGDQLAKIAIALLVFERSHSPLLTALSWAVTYLPWLIGGPWLSVYADRLPRRHVMILCDLVRGLAMAGVAIPHVPIALALLLVGAASFLQPPFNSARAALVPDVLPDPTLYAAATALGSTTFQLAQVLGFGVGGLAVTLMSPRGAIIADVVSFMASAAVVGALVQHREGHAREAAGRTSRRDALQFLTRPGRVRDLVVVTYVVVASTIVPEAIAVPYAAAHHDGSATAGLLTAAVPLGTVIGVYVLNRLAGQDRAERAMWPLALATAAVLAITSFDPPPIAAFIIWVVGGAGSAMIVTFNVYLGRLTPPPLRGRVFGLVGTGLAVVQGIAAVLGGWIAEHMSPATAVGDVALPALGVLVVLAARNFTTSSSDNALASIPESNDQEDEETVTARPVRPRPEPRMWGATAAMGAAAVLLLLPVWHEHAILRVDVPLWWFFLLFFVVQAYPLQFAFRRANRSVLLDSIALVLGLFFLSPIALVLIRQLAKTSITVAMRRRAPVVAMFNIVGGAFYTCAAVDIFRLLAPAHASGHPHSWLAVIVAVVADDVIAAAAVAYAGWLYNNQLQLRTVWQPAAFSLTVNLVNTCLGIVTADAITYDAANAAMITVFVVLTLAGFRTYHRLADRHAALDRLYAFAKNLGPVTPEPSEMGPALTQLRELLRAPQLEMSLFGEADVATVYVARDDEMGLTFSVSERAADRDVVERLLAAAPASRLPWVRRRRAVALSAEEMAVSVGERERPLGVLRALTSTSAGRAFDRNDLRLLQAVADQLAAALEKGNLIQNLRRAATRDSLTGLANLDTLRSFLSTMLREQSTGVVLLVDIDRFHDINDTLGHDSGDAVLVQVARRLEDATTHGSLACRVGGDQFALVVPGQSNSELARLAALAVKSRVDGPIRLADVAADVRVTIGMARAPEHGDDAATILRRAEIAMGAAKGGSAGISEWEPQLERDGSRRLYVLAGLRQALSDSELTVEFQPKLLLGSGEVTGFEALVRWRHPDLGLVSPAEFIPLAEATGLIGALTSSVLRLALETCRRWHDQNLNVGVAVNISARSLDDPVLVGQVAALLTATGLDGRALTLEITESSVMENPARSLEVLRQLRSLGVRLSIDDFGTGYSSLHQLRGLPVHEVKIDKTFVDNIDRDGADRAVIRAVVELCESLGLATVAEGVEQASQAYVLEGLGVRQVQGYFYGRPMAEADATKWLRHRPILAKQVEESQRG